MNPAGSNHQNSNKSKAVAIIPARFASTRLLGKALIEIAGKPMISWVVEHSLAARNVDRVIVATDDLRILRVVEAAGYEAVLTSPDHHSGTDRLAEVASSLKDAEIIVNVQGDEPLIAAETIDQAVEALMAEDPALGAVGIVTTFEPIESVADVLNPDIVKIVVSADGQALYFSRSSVPYPRDAARKFGGLEAALLNDSTLLNSFRKHTGLYVYRRDVLLQFVKWPQSELEIRESLEQLRALEHGVTIKAIQASSPSIGVDNLNDLEHVRAILENSGSTALD